MNFNDNIDSFTYIPLNLVFQKNKKLNNKIRKREMKL